MTTPISILLGIIQGLTEFLPVSSSGHLEIAKTFFESNRLPQESLLMTIVLHGATALSTLVVFRKTVIELITEFFQWKKNKAFYFVLYILISMVPAVLIGLFFEELISNFFHNNIGLVGAMLIFTASLLYLADKAQPTSIDLNAKSAFLIGLMQAVAILPGISRSGATIATATLLGIDKEKAARFSFLMVIPLILGSMAKSLLEYTPTSSTPITPLVIGFVTAFITGVFACKWMLVLVKKAKLKYFGAYCFTVGIAALLWTFIK